MYLGSTKQYMHHSPEADHLSRCLTVNKLCPQSFINGIQVSTSAYSHFVMGKSLAKVWLVALRCLVICTSPSL